MQNTLNYKDLTFSYFMDGSSYDGSSFHILSTTYLDYHHDIKSITIKHQTLGRKNIWLAEFSGVTTEYTGSLAEVLQKAYDYYQQNSIHSHINQKASNNE